MPVLDPLLRATAAAVLALPPPFRVTSMSMFDKLAEVEARYGVLETQLADPEVLAKQQTFQKLAKERSDIAEIVDAYRAAYKRTTDALAENSPLLRESDAELRGMAREEEARLTAERTTLEERLKLLLLPKDPNDEKTSSWKSRGGTGGEEAALFARDLFRMYSRYAERKRWTLEILSLSDSSSGGIKEVLLMISAPAGGRVYSELKYESGVHRVQRVPETEAQGRIHTSAATVVVLPKPKTWM